MVLQYFIQRILQGIYLEIIRFRFGHFIRRCTEGQFHFKILISFCAHAPAKTVHTRISHAACLRQIRDGHKQYLIHIPDYKICYFFLCFSKLIIV